MITLPISVTEKWRERKKKKNHKLGWFLFNIKQLFTFSIIFFFVFFRKEDCQIVGWMPLTSAKWIHMCHSKTRSPEQEQIHQTTCMQKTQCSLPLQSAGKQINLLRGRQEIRLSQMKHGVSARQTALTGCMQCTGYCLSICLRIMHLHWFRESLPLEFCHSFCRSGFYPGSLFVTSNSSSYNKAHNAVRNVAEKTGLTRESVYKIQSFLSKHHEEPCLLLFLKHICKSA